jgi:hypothetical protein
MGTHAHPWPIGLRGNARIVLVIRVAVALALLATAGFLTAKALAPHGTPSEPARLIAPA